MSAETLRSVLEKQLAYASGDQSNHSLYIERMLLHCLKIAVCLSLYKEISLCMEAGTLCNNGVTATLL